MLYSANHTCPSGPIVIPDGPAPAVGVEIRSKVGFGPGMNEPTSLSLNSVNQIRPPGATVIRSGPPSAPGRSYSVT